MSIALLLVALAGRVSAEARHRQAAYLELFGKGGLGGVGYDVELLDRLGVGAVASFYVLDDQRVLSLSPYAGTYLLGGLRHRWFVHGGPQLVRVSIRSTVPEWSGTTSTGLGAELSSGWEYRHRVLLRVFAMVTAGKGGVAPWMGVSIGWTR